MAGFSQPLTLADWVRRFAAAGPDEALRELATLPADKRERLLHAQALLSSLPAGGAIDQAPSLEAASVEAVSVEDLGAFLEGSLDTAATARVEQSCWKTPAQLAELLSLASFVAVAPPAEGSASLQSRLLALAPSSEPFPVGNQGKSPKYRLLEAAEPKRNGKPVSPPVATAPRRAGHLNGTSVVLQKSLSEHDSRAPTTPWTSAYWLLAAAAILLAMFASAGVGWLAATRRSPRLGEDLVRPSEQPSSAESVAQHPSPRRNPEPNSLEQSPIENVGPFQKNAVEPTVPIVSSAAIPESTDDVAPESSVVPFVPIPQPIAPRVAALPPRSIPPGPRPLAPELAISSPQGVMLYDVGLRGTWRVARQRHDLVEPLRVLSLAESWTRVEVPEVGTLVFEGDVEAALAMLADGTIEIRMAYGRMGVEDLRAGAKLRLVTGETACTAQGLEARSTLAVVSDPLSPGLMVPEGALLVDSLELREGQVIRWQDGLPLAAQPLGAPALGTPSVGAPALGTPSLGAPSLGASDQGNLGATASSTLPPAVNPWDLSWLEEPNDARQKQWQLTYGALAERLIKADDAGSELIHLADNTREPRMAALAARWSMAANPSTRRSRVWNMLTDRRVAVRLAAVRCLLEAPPGDARGIEFGLVMREKLGEPVADHIDEWLAGAWQPGPPPRTQAGEIVEHLQHSELAVRQIAVSLLELHAGGALVQMGIRPPAYDPTARASRRAAAYAEWKAAMVQLYSPNRKFPAQPGAAQPQRQRALQNGAGGT